MNINKVIENRNLVSKRIMEILLDSSFKLDPIFLSQIHSYLFSGIILQAGTYRTCNLSKKEPILNGNSVIYADYHNIERYLEFDFLREKEIRYTGLSHLEFLKKLANFTINIWLTHPFMEGNTRTVCVFIEKYLNYLGYPVNNNLFKYNDRYFRNSLVRGAYYNYELGIEREPKYLETFYSKLLFDPYIQLSHTDLFISQLFDEKTKVKIRTKK